MSILECQSCGYRYNPDLGDPQARIPPGTPFDGLPGSWRCPECGAGLEDFEEGGGDYLDELPEGEEDPLDEDLPSEEGGLDDEVDPLSPVQEAEELEEDASAEEESDEDLDRAFGPIDELDEEELDGFDDEDEDDAILDQAFSTDEGLLDDDVPEEADDEPEDEPAELNEDNFEDEDEDPAYEDDEAVDPLDDLRFEPGTRFICSRCDYIFDPLVGDPAAGVAPGNAFEDILDAWSCPRCGAPYEQFKPHEDAPELRQASPRDRKEEQGGVGIVLPSQLVQPVENVHPYALLDELLLRPAPLFSVSPEAPISTLTRIGPRAVRPLQLSTPLMVAPMSLGASSGLMKVVAARATARIGTACLTGGDALHEASQAAGAYVVEVIPGLPFPVDAELHHASALELVLGPAWDRADGRGGAYFTRGMVPLPQNEQDLERLLGRLREGFDGPIGVRIPAGQVEADLDRLAPAAPDYVVLEALGSGLSGAPLHIRSSARLPAWWAVFRASTHLKQLGNPPISLLVTGPVRHGADCARLLALGADAIVLCDETVTGTGLEPLRQAFRTPGSSAMLELAVDSAQAVDHLVGFLQRLTVEIIDICRLCGHPDVHSLSSTDLVTTSNTLSERLELTRLS